eukprot:4264916-Pleurochrysis_carterae.AAC.1
MSARDHKTNNACPFTTKCVMLCLPTQLNVPSRDTRAQELANSRALHIRVASQHHTVLDTLWRLHCPAGNVIASAGLDIDP